jgi:hypothetical protein
MNRPDWVTPKQASELLSIHPKSVYRLAKKLDINDLKMVRKRRYYRYDALLELKVTPGNPVVTSEGNTEVTPVTLPVTIKDRYDDMSADLLLQEVRDRIADKDDQIRWLRQQLEMLQDRFDRLNDERETQARIIAQLAQSKNESHYIPSEPVIVEEAPQQPQKEPETFSEWLHKFSA